MPGLLENTRRDGDCLIWLGYINVNGYAIVGRNTLAHRESYRLYVGDLPQGKVIHHVCGVKPCINPLHLQPLTKGEHIHAEMELQGRGYLWRNRRRNR